MMEISLFSVVALLFLGRLISLPRAEARQAGWLMTLQVFPLFLSIGILWSVAPTYSGGLTPPPLVVAAVDEQGQFVDTTVVIEPKDERRIVRRIPIQIEKAAAVELALLILVVSSLALALGHFFPGSPNGGRLSIVNAVLCISLLGSLLQGPLQGGGEASVRAFLSTFPSDFPPVSFSIPDGNWHYRQPFLGPTVAAVLACLFVLLFSRLPRVLSESVPFELLAAFACFVAIVVQGIGAQGFPFRPTEVILMTSLSALAAVAVYAQTMPTRLLGFGAVVASLSFVV